MIDKKVLIYVAIFIAGVMLADKARQLPGIKMLPSI